MLVLAAAPLDDAALLALAHAAPGSPVPAALVARFSRGALERRRRGLRDAPHRRETDR